MRVLSTARIIGARAYGAHDRSGCIPLLVVVALIATGCLSNTGSQGTSKGTATSTGGKSKGFSGNNGGDLPTGSAESFITVVDVVRSNKDPNSLIELIGQDSQIGTQCPSTNDCSCVFSWTESTGIFRETEQVPSRVETNMIRCLFTTVSATASFFDVKVKIKAADLSSNTKRVFMSAANPSLDPSIAVNYLPVQRFMCRDLLGAAQNTRYYKSNLVDPRLWTSEFSIAFNFYTTSFGKDYGAVAQARGDGQPVTTPGYECPLKPNDMSDSSLYNLNLYSLAEIDLTDPTRVDVAPGTGDNTIYPPDDNLNLSTTRCSTGDEATCEKFLANRHDFYVSSFMGGVFKQPVCIFHSVANMGANGGAPPALACQVPDTTSSNAIVGSMPGGEDIIGFAAMPDANQKCPDINTVKIPAGKKWGKLWQFRLSYQKRTIQDVANADAVNNLFCTYRDQECMSNRTATVDVNGDGVVAGALHNDVNSICYNSRPTSRTANIGPQATPLGTGNCRSTGNVGDGNGPGAGGIYPGVNDVLACLGGKNAATTASIFDNCCFDLNAPLPDGAQAISNRPANFTDGGDFCNPALIGENNASAVATTSGLCSGGACIATAGGEGGLAQDIWLVGDGSRRACIEADTNAQGKLALTTFPPAKQSNPFQTSPKEIDVDSRFDIVYIVTPESVKFEDMQDVENNKIARQYTPFKLKADGVTRLSYRLDSDSLNNTNPVARLSKFPLCVLQDAKKGASGSL